MATREVTQLATLTFRPSLLHPPHNPAHAPQAFAQVCTQLQAVPGVYAVYLGRQLEHPGQWSWAIRWKTGAALDAFAASPSYKGWLADLYAVVDTYVSAKAVMQGNVSAALNAPCTEIFNALDTEPDFLDDRMRPFSNCFDPSRVQGFRGLGFGQWVPTIHEGVEIPRGINVSLLIGWDSKEAHLAQRGHGKIIDNNLPKVREGRKATSMYHVNFTRL